MPNAKDSMRRRIVSEPTLKKQKNGFEESGFEPSCELYNYRGSSYSIHSIKIFPILSC